jgi:peptidoglycan/LPS O-acetylase OafA/YrhL
MRTRQHIPELDGLRGVAVLLVFWFHLNLPLLGVQCPHWTWLGVDLFFILSGFLNTRNLLFNREQGISTKRFAARRVARIVPAAYLCILLTILLYGVQDSLYAATYTLNFAIVLGRIRTWHFGHYWSLCVEEQFYILWAAILTLCALRFTKRFAWLMLLACPWISLAGILAIDWYDPEKAAARWFYATNHLVTRGWPLWVGTLLAIYEPYLKDKPRVLIGMAIGCAIACLAICSFYPPVNASTAPDGAELTFGILGPQFGIVTFFLLVLSKQTRPYFLVLQAKWLCWIGAISYGLYLYHMVCFNLFLGRPLVAVAASFLVAAASYYLFEMPIMRWERKWELRHYEELETVPQATP